MNSRITLVIGVAVLAAMVSGCGGTSSGTPTAQSTSTTPTSSSVDTTPATATTTSRLLPLRPRDIDISAVDPCSVLTHAQLRTLAYDLGYQRQPSRDTSPIYNGPTCNFASTGAADQSSTGFGSTVGISTSEGVEAWLTDPARKTSADLAKKDTVAGFPALVLPNPKVSDDCSVVVDVHDGQYLEIQTLSSDPDMKKPTNAYCGEAKRVAGMAIQTIESTR